MAPSMASPSNIPLLCGICPKKPHFTDISHLLTHIASKGHLSNLFKKKVRATSDPQAQQDVDVYEDWYETWNLGSLMAARMSQKDKRKPKRRSQSTRNDVSPDVVPSSNVPESSFDPNLFMAPEANMLHDSFLTATMTHSEYDPPLYNWDVSRPASWEVDLVEARPEPPDASPNLMLQQPVDYWSIDLPYGNLQSPTVTVDDEECEVSESLQLKGIILDGMDLFDAATPDMKRKRNQKKDISVLEHLQRNASSAEPVEVVYASTSLEKTLQEQTITGRVDPNSPSFRMLGLPGNALSRPSMERRPLSICDPNIRQRAGSSVSDRSKHRISLSDEGLDRMKPPSKQIKTGRDHPGMHRKRAFSVYNDTEDDGVDNIRVCPRGPDRDAPVVHDAGTTYAHGTRKQLSESIDGIENALASNCSSASTNKAILALSEHMKTTADEKRPCDVLFDLPYDRKVHPEGQGVTKKARQRKKLEDQEKAVAGQRSTLSPAQVEKFSVALITTDDGLHESARDNMISARTRDEWYGVFDDDRHEALSDFTKLLAMSSPAFGVHGDSTC